MARKTWRGEKRLPRQLPPQGSPRPRLGVIPNDPYLSPEPVRVFRHRVGSDSLPIGAGSKRPTWPTDISVVKKALESKEHENTTGTVKVFETEGKLALTFRQLGAHAILTPDPDSGLWHAEIWLVPAEPQQKTFWLSKGSNTANPLFYRIPFYLLSTTWPAPHEGGIQDLALACRLGEKADAYGTLRDPYLALEIREDPNWWYGKTVNTESQEGGLLLTALSLEIVSRQVDNALSHLVAALGEDVHVDVFASRGSMHVNTIGEHEGYRWELSPGNTLRITPPGADIRQPYWNAYLDNALSDREIANALPDLFARATPILWTYWFKEKHRGRRLRRVTPLAILEDGTPCWLGRGETAEEAYLEVLNAWSILGMQDQGSGTPYPKRKPGRKRHRGSCPRRDNRIDIDPTPLFEDPRDFTKYRHPREVPWR